MPHLRAQRVAGVHEQPQRGVTLYIICEDRTPQRAQQHWRQHLRGDRAARAAQHPLRKRQRLRAETRCSGSA